MTLNYHNRLAGVGKQILPPVIYFLLMLLIGLFVRDIALQPGILTHVADFGEALARFDRVSDPGSFLIGARDIAKEGWVTPGNMWVLHLWPPGFIFLEGLILHLGGEAVPFLLVILIFSCVAYAAMLEMTRRLLRQFTGEWVAFILPLIPFLFPFTRLFLLEPAGLALGEGFAIAFFMTAVIVLLNGSLRFSIAKAASAGVLLAASAYFRSQYELLISFLTLGAIFMAAWLWFRVAKLEPDSAAKRAMKCTVKTMAVTLIVAHLLMSPWRLHNYLESGSLSWVQTQQLVIRNSLSTREELIKGNAWFVIEGGGDLACRLVPEYCDKTEPALFYKAFFKNVIPWYRAKLEVIGDYWFSSPENLGRLKYPNTIVDKLSNGLILLMLVLTVPLLIFIRRWDHAPLVYWVHLAFYGCFLCILTFVQFEVRYFYLIKIFSIAIFVILAALACKIFHPAVRRSPQGTAISLDEN